MFISLDYMSIMVNCKAFTMLRSTLKFYLPRKESRVFVCSYSKYILNMNKATISSF